MTLVTILDIMCFYLKHNISEIGFCALLQMVAAQLSPIDRDLVSVSVSVCGPESETSSIYWALLSVFNLNMETESSIRNVVF
jgi:hypothetical protein